MSSWEKAFSQNDVTCLEPENKCVLQRQNTVHLDMSLWNTFYFLTILLEVLNESDNNMNAV